MLVACESCDLLLSGTPVPRGTHASCSRCGQRLYGSELESLERALALTIAAAVLIVLANAFPFLRFSLEGQVQDNHILTGIIALYDAGFQPLAGLVLLTTVLAPLLEISLNLWSLIPTVIGFRMPGTEVAARISARLKTWSMLEVYLLAVIVAVVKLAMMATVNLDMGAYAFFVLIGVMTATRSVLEVDALWSRIEATQ